ncbi:MAG: helix-turn-helix domain-containing protein [Bacteroidales bacterium]|nr:helix-turn-helix domain-containing protein [Bacteroidales bacterium]
MKDRILQFLKAENKSSAQLAEEIGVQPSGISHILSGRNKPSLDFVLKMLEKYKFLSTEWLLFGAGNMYREPGMQQLFEQGSDAEPGEMLKGSGKTEKITEKHQAADENINTQEAKPELEKIVWFFRDGSFREYSPGR